MSQSQDCIYTIPPLADVPPGSIPTSALASVEGTGSKVQLTNQGATVNGDVVTYDASGNVQDSGTLLSSLAPLVSPSFTTPALGTPSSGTLSSCTGLPATGVSAGALANGMTATTQSAFSNDTKLSTDAYADNNFKGVSVAGFRDDFISPTGSTTFSTTGSTFSSDSVWFGYGITATTASSGPIAGTFANPGLYTLTTAAAAGGDGAAFVKTAAQAPMGALGSNAGWEINFITKISGTATIAVRVGACAANTANTDPPTDGIWVEYDTANVGNTDSKFTWVTRVGSASTYTTTNAIAADTNFHHFKIRSVLSGTILFSVDGGTETAVTSGVTAVALAPFLQILTRTTSNRTLTIDFYSYMAATGRS